ncbi:acyltransferase [Paenibacillus terrigena]|uniref:acyltransferase n=1 Tax=Paenibacillus terrigena TaxID=369333 RepID=UPI0003764E5F|nr:acyltransferase [Paenibacillus terrigena]
MNRKPKILEIQSLRGLAFLAVVMQHAVAHYAAVPEMQLEDGVMMTILLVLAKFAVPVFVFITGLVLFYNDKDDFNYGDFIKKRFSDIILPYLIWSAIYYVSTYGWNDLWRFLQMGFTGKASYHLWYVVMVMQFYLLFPLWRIAIRWLHAKLMGWRGVAALMLAGVLYIVLMGHVSDLGQWTKLHPIPVITDLFNKYADRNALYYYFYFVMGAAAGLHFEQWKRILERYKFIYWTVFIGLSGYYVYISVGAFQTSQGIKFNFYQVFLLRPLMAVLLMSSILAVYHLAIICTRQSTAHINRLLTWIGMYSYGAYLAHAVTLRLGYIVDRYLLLELSVTARMLIVMGIAAGTSVLLTVMISRIPYGKWIVGIQVRNPRSKQRVEA